MHTKCRAAHGNVSKRDATPREGRNRDSAVCAKEREREAAHRQESAGKTREADKADAHSAAGDSADGHTAKRNQTIGAVTHRDDSACDASFPGFRIRAVRNMEQGPAKERCFGSVIETDHSSDHCLHGGWECAERARDILDIRLDLADMLVTSFDIVLE